MNHQYLTLLHARGDTNMAVEIRDSVGLGIALIIVEVLFWVFVCYRIIKYRKNKKNK